MFINEISKESPIELCIRVQNKVIKLNTKVIKDSSSDQQNKFALCALIIINNKILQLHGHHMMVFVHNVKDNRDYKFEIYKSEVDKKNRVLKLYSISDVKAENYRNAYRFPCSYKTVLQVGSNKKVINCFTHDISYTGISYIVTAGDIHANIGDTVSGCIYVTEDRMKRTSGKIVRVVDEYHPDMVLLGVSFENETKVQNIIGTLQLRELKIRHGDKVQ